jgi:hypothetical protein
VFAQATALAATAVAIGSGLLASRAGAATSKLSPRDIGYQDTPKGRQRCDLCVNWQPPNACKMVAGSINPSGWCGLFAPAH